MSTHDREGAFVVKVRTCLNDPSLPALIYDEGRSFMIQVPPEEVAERMGDQIKAFFYATLRGEELVLGDAAPYQEW